MRTLQPAGAIHLKRDSRCRLRYAALQTDFAATILQRHSLNPCDLDTVYLVENCGQPEEHLSARSDAVISVLRQIGGPWQIAAAVLQLIPRQLRDWGYKMIARHRYRIFGRSVSCLLPDANYRDRFLDV